MTLIRAESTGHSCDFPGGVLPGAGMATSRVAPGLRKVGRRAGMRPPFGDQPSRPFFADPLYQILLDNNNRNSLGLCRDEERAAGIHELVREAKLQGAP